MHPSRKPENWPVIAFWMGALAFVSVAVLTWLPPLIAPARWLSVLSWIVPLTWLGGIVGAIIAAMRGMKRSWKVSCIALVVAGLSIVSIRYPSKGDDWRPLFRSTGSARGALVEDASNRNPARYPFPESLKAFPMTSPTSC